MKLLFCMADPETARDAGGHFPPRYFRPWKSTTILDEVVNQVVQSGAFNEVYFVANIKHRTYQPHLAYILKQYNIPEKNLYFIPTSKGQADSAFVACHEILKATTDSPIFIHNADTILLGRDFKKITALLKTADGFVDSFHAYNPDYSYILSNAAGVVQEVAEKSVISNLATSGFYGFSSVNSYIEYFKKTDFGNRYYISTIYNTLLRDQKVVKTINEADNYRTLVLDSEEEYKTNSLLMETLY